MRAIRDQIIEVLTDRHPMTVRQVFYRLVNRTDPLIAKTENECKNTVGRLLVAMRRQGEIPYAWIADNTRYYHKSTTYDSLGEALQSTARTYRRALWTDADVNVEIWVEKDALTGVIFETTDKWDVPLFPFRGFNSHSALYTIAEQIAESDKPTYIYYFGDWDPSGKRVDGSAIRLIREFIEKIDPSALDRFRFERVAVTQEQIAQWNLPTRPTKRKKNSHAKGFVGRSVDVDAIEPEKLQELVEGSILRHVDHGRIERLRLIEEQERNTMRQYAARMGYGSV